MSHPPIESLNAERRRRLANRPPAIAAVLAIALHAPLLGAQGNEPTLDRSTELFRQGRQLRNKGRFADACEKFRASLELRRSPGTLLNVASCLEAEGKLVSALAALEETLTLSRGGADARKAAVWTGAAEGELATLMPRLAHLELRTPPQGTQVTLDGLPLTDFGRPLRLDPGPHHLVASAAGKRTFARDFELSEGQTETFAIPALVDLPPEPPAPSPPPRGSVLTPAVDSASDMGSDSSDRLPWSLVGGGGIVFLGGAVVGLVAAGMSADLKDKCPNKQCDDGLSERDRAFTTAVTADVLMATGLVSAAVGAVWLLTADDDAPELRAGCTTAGCAASLRGTF